MLTVNAALQLPCLREARLVAGRSGADAVISGVNIMEVPEVVRWLRGGELLFTAGFAFKDSPEVRLSLPQALKRKGVAALAIKPGQYFDSIPVEIVRQCDQLGLALVELPPDLPYMDVMLPIIELIISDQMRRLKKSEEIHRLMLDTVLSGRGFAGIALCLAELTQRPVLVVDQDCVPRGVAGLRVTGEEPCRLQLHPEAGRYGVKLTVDDDEQEGIAVPARTGRATCGFVLVLGPVAELEEQDVVAAEQASTAVALEFAKERAVAEAERRVAGELVEEVISGHFHNEEVLYSRARSLGVNLRRPLRVFFLELNRPGQPASDMEGNPPARARRTASAGGTDGSGELFDSDESRLLRAVRVGATRFPGAVLAATRSGGVVGVAQFRERDQATALSELLEEVIETVRRMVPGVDVAAGVGRLCGLQNAAESYQDALAAIRVGRLLDLRRVTVIDNLGPYTFLTEVRSSRSLLQFYAATLGRVVDYDLQNHAELTRTLQAYLDNRCSVERAARALFVHKNSVLYRLRRIEQLTGLSLGDASGRFSLELALRLAPLVDGRLSGLFEKG
ncbi:MAG TPA: PucR family transcriptional regulator [Firmicutes bacterium]|nr:PucR family transcriptional regulator [Bacillota bacterium]